MGLGLSWSHLKEYIKEERPSSWGVVSKGWYCWD